jgi:hypothetical protein
VARATSETAIWRRRGVIPAAVLAVYVLLAFPALHQRMARACNDVGGYIIGPYAPGVEALQALIHSVAATYPGTDQ